MLISGKEAKLAWASGDTVGYIADGKLWITDESTPLGVFDSFSDWQVKPRTILINGIEVPAPFKPKKGGDYWHVFPSRECGYGFNYFESFESDSCWMQFGAWETEEEIKQVVEAWRSIFK